MLDLTNLRGLVAEGGGAKGYAYGGVPAALQKLGLLDKLTDVAGSSAGAIFAMQLALGATYEEIWRDTMDSDFSIFLAYRFPAAYRALRHLGWYHPAPAERWLKSQVKKYTGREDTTMAELHGLTQMPRPSRRFRHLVVTATDLRGRKTVLLSAATVPDMPVWKAVRASMSLPFVWPPVSWNGMLLVDGGLAMNLPFPALSHLEPSQIFGLRVDTGKELRHQYAPVKGFASFILATISMLVDRAGSAHLRPEDFCRTVVIDVANTSTLDFAMPKTKKLGLVMRGHQETLEFFVQRKWEKRLNLP